MASNIIKHANSKGIEMVAQTYVPLSQLQIIEPEEGNREEDKPHTKSFEDKIMENGMMDSIKVFPFNEKTQSYKVAEANHRVRGLNNIFQDDEDPMVPISILYWKDGEDPEEVKQTVIEFNVTGKAWTNYNFVRSHSESGHFPKDVQSLWKEIFNNMKRLKPRITNACVISIYAGTIRSHPKVKDLVLAKKFRLDTYQRAVVDKMLDRLDTFTNNHGKRLCNTQFMRLYIHNLRRKARELNNFTNWEKFFQRSIEQLNTKARFSDFVAFPSDDVSFDHWFEAV
tara:strand:+ start:1606 stop:2454 length:849 start_codon:yes stop_codon:yes gene_type:complete